MTIQTRQLVGMLLATIGFVSAGTVAESADTSGTAVGHRAVVSGVRFASGEWSIKSRQTCPAAARGNEPKMVIYAAKLTPGVLKLAAAMEEQIVKDEELKWSFVEILDEKGARTTFRSNEYYSANELDDRLKEVRNVAEKHNIKHLTLGLSTRPRAEERDRIGIPANADALVVFIQGQPTQSRMVKFVKAVDSSQLDDDAIESLIRAMNEVRSR